MFLVHYNQKGGAIANIDLPLNVLKRGSITYYSINFIVNQQRASDNQNFLTDNRSWLTSVPL